MNSSPDKDNADSPNDQQDNESGSHNNCKTKAGYVAIIGSPNAGKSTLLNKLIGEKLAIVTQKPQTTRKRVLGILTQNNTQIIFLDTPGILNPKYQLQKNMMSYVHNSVAEADFVVYIVDASKHTDSTLNYDNDSTNYLIPKNVSTILDKIKASNKKMLLLLNKIDLLGDVKNILPIIEQYSKTNLFEDIVPLSALKEKKLYHIIDTIAKHLPHSAYYYDEELLSTQPQRFFVSEIVRENILVKFQDEVPYSTEIDIIRFEERENSK